MNAIAFHLFLCKINKPLIVYSTKIMLLCTRNEETVAHIVFRLTLHVVHLHGERCDVSSLRLLGQDIDDDGQRVSRQGELPLVGRLHDHCHGVALPNDTSAAGDLPLPCIPAIGRHHQRLELTLLDSTTNGIKQTHIATGSIQSASATIS